MKYLLILTYLFSFSETSFASFVYNNECKTAYSEIINLQFSKAGQRLKAEHTNNPSNQIPYLLENYIDFLTVIIGEEENDFKRLKVNLEPRLQQIASDDKKSAWFLYSQAVIYLQSGFARVKFGEYLSAGLDINRAYRLLEENQRKFPSFSPNKAGLGMLHAVIGTIPAKYRWVARTFSFDGSIALGSTELQESYVQIAADPQLDFMLPEVAFILSFVMLNISADMPAALQLAAKFCNPPFETVVKESPLLSYALANIYAKTGSNEKAINLLSSYPHTPDRYPFHYLNYMLGVAKLNRLDKDANLPLLGFVADFKGKNYIKSAYLHLAWFYMINHQPVQYETYMQRIALRGSNQVDNDREALKVAEKGVKPDLSLLKARLLFDGGYYDLALAELSGFTASDKKSELEHTYRLGRIYDKSGKTAQAIRYYEKTIQVGGQLPYYYAANSALQLGLIYEHSKNTTLAKSCYEKVLDMDFDEYRLSITNKAEAGLRRLKGK